MVINGVQAKVEMCHKSDVKLHESEWFTCSWKITNIGELPFSPHTRLVKVSFFLFFLFFSRNGTGVCLFAVGDGRPRVQQWLRIAVLLLQ